MHTHEPEMKRTSLVLPAADHQRLVEIARANDRDFSKQIRYLIRQCIAESERAEQTEAAA